MLYITVCTYHMSKFLQLNLHHTNHFNYYHSQPANVSNSKQNNEMKNSEKDDEHCTEGESHVFNLFFSPSKATLS